MIIYLFIGYEATIFLYLHGYVDNRSIRGKLVLQNILSYAVTVHVYSMTL